MGVYFTGVHLMGVYLTGVAPHKRASHRRAPPWAYTFQIQKGFGEKPPDPPPGFVEI
jgi:hypothetical protein